MQQSSCVYSLLCDILCLQCVCVVYLYAAFKNVIARLDYYIRILEKKTVQCARQLKEYELPILNTVQNLLNVLVQSVYRIRSA